MIYRLLMYHLNVLQCFLSVFICVFHSLLAVFFIYCIFRLFSIFMSVFICVVLYFPSFLFAVFYTIFLNRLFVSFLCRCLFNIFSCLYLPISHLFAKGPSTKFDKNNISCLRIKIYKHHFLQKSTHGLNVNKML